jgi:hypothetical protein
MGQIDLSTYGGLLHPEGYEGGLVDMNVFKSTSRTNLGALPIYFGRAVARYNPATSNTTGCRAPIVDDDVLIGLSLRIIAGHAVSSIMSGSVAPDTALFMPQDSIPVAFDADVFVIPVENVTAGDRVVSITSTNGQLGSAQNTASGIDAQAKGTATFTGVGAVGDTVTINGVAFTAIAADGAAPTAAQYVLGTTAATTAANFYAQASTSNAAGLQTLGLTLNGPTVTATANAAGTAGNAYTLATTSGAVTVSGATLTGGQATTTGVGTGRILLGSSYFTQTALAGTLSKVRVRGVGTYINS